MRDLRDIAAETVRRLTGQDNDDWRDVVHDALRSYGTDLLMNLAHAIAPTSDAEIQAVAWLRQELVRVAKQISEV